MGFNTHSVPFGNRRKLLRCKRFGFFSGRRADITEHRLQSRRRYDPYHLKRLVARVLHAMPNTLRNEDGCARLELRPLVADDDGALTGVDEKNLVLRVMAMNWDTAANLYLLGAHRHSCGRCICGIHLNEDVSAARGRA